MDALLIAISKAEIFNRMRNWGQYSTFDGSYDPRPFNGLGGHEEEFLLRKLEIMETKLAISRAKATQRDFETVLKEVELEVMVELAKILAKTIDPVLTSLSSVTVKNDGEVCAVCQDEICRGEEAWAMKCMHVFHRGCIAEWLKRTRTCPVCRYHMEVEEVKIEFSNVPDQAVGEVSSSTLSFRE